MSIGDRIRTEREKMGITQTDLAKAISVSKQTLYKYENNIITNIPSDKIEKLSQILDISPDYIMGWNKDYDLCKKLKKIEKIENIFESLSQKFNCSVDEVVEILSSKKSNLLPSSKKEFSQENIEPSLKQNKINCSQKNIELTLKEQKHIKKYRTLDSYGKDMVDTVLDKEYTRCESIKQNVIVSESETPISEHSFDTSNKQTNIIIDNETCCTKVAVPHFTKVTDAKNFLYTRKHLAAWKIDELTDEDIITMANELSLRGE